MRTSISLVLILSACFISPASGKSLPSEASFSTKLIHLFGVHGTNSTDLWRVARGADSLPSKAFLLLKVMLQETWFGFWLAFTMLFSLCLVAAAIFVCKFKKPFMLKYGRAKPKNKEKRWKRSRCVKIAVAVTVLTALLGISAGVFGHSSYKVLTTLIELNRQIPLSYYNLVIFIRKVFEQYSSSIYIAHQELITVGDNSVETAHMHEISEFEMLKDMTISENYITKLADALAHGQDALNSSITDAEDIIQFFAEMEDTGRENDTSLFASLHKITDDRLEILYKFVDIFRRINNDAGAIASQNGANLIEVIDSIEQVVISHIQQESERFRNHALTLAGKLLNGTMLLNMFHEGINGGLQTLRPTGSWIVSPEQLLSVQVFVVGLTVVMGVLFQTYLGGLVFSVWSFFKGLRVPHSRSCLSDSLGSMVKCANYSIIFICPILTLISNTCLSAAFLTENHLCMPTRQGYFHVFPEDFVVKPFDLLMSDALEKSQKDVSFFNLLSLSRFLSFQYHPYEHLPAQMNARSFDEELELLQHTLEGRHAFALEIENKIDRIVDDFKQQTRAIWLLQGDIDAKYGSEHEMERIKHHLRILIEHDADVSKTQTALEDIFRSLSIDLDKKMMSLDNLAYVLNTSAFNLPRKHVAQSAGQLELIYEEFTHNFTKEIGKTGYLYEVFLSTENLVCGELLRNISDIWLTFLVFAVLAAMIWCAGKHLADFLIRQTKENFQAEKLTNTKNPFIEVLGTPKVENAEEELKLSSIAMNNIYQ